MHTKRVLVADDSILMREQIRRILAPDWQFEICAEAVDGRDALQKAQQCHPDLVVLDFVMPGMNGLEATREMKKIMPRLPIVLFALDNSPELESESKRAGVDAVLPKSAGSTNLTRVMRLLIHED